jgi:hypothetical protein
MKISDEQIAHVMGHFDFDKVADLYSRLNWTWWENVPVDKDMLVEAAYRKLKELQQRYPKTKSIESGGLKVEACTDDNNCTEVELVFIDHQTTA